VARRGDGQTGQRRGGCIGGGEGRGARDESMKKGRVIVVSRGITKRDSLELRSDLEIRFSFSSFYLFLDREEEVVF
jgi:hypothetical protein